MGDYEEAFGDLEEVREIADCGGMKLWLADYHLEAASGERAGGGSGYQVIRMWASGDEGIRDVSIFHLLLTIY